MQDCSTFHDVIIAGAGPVGLLLAGELRLGGCSVLVLERAAAPRPPLKELPFGLRGLSVATIESFDRRGLLQPLQERAARPAARDVPHWMRQPSRRPAGHFAGIQFFHDHVDPAQWPYRLPEPAGNLAVDLASIEDVLAARATALGVEIRRGVAVEEVDAASDGVAVHAGGATFRGGWLVGCDGGRSVVRKTVGFGFTGTAPEFTGYSALVTFADPACLPSGRHHTPAGMYMFTPPGTLNIADFDGGAAHRTEVTRERLQAVLREVSGTDATVTALELATTWTDRAYQASTYRRGRVLLAGDAAHVHSPLGGQGLNLGLGDAMNLGWKLAATVRGDAPADLLDTYEAERHPVGAQVLAWSRAQVALMRPNPGTSALAAIFRDLVETRDGATYCAERIWGVGLRYDLGDVHPLVGRSAPDFRFDDGSRLADQLRGGRGLLVDFDGRCGDEFHRLGRPIDVLSTGARERMGLSALLVRPDGIVAWAADAAGDAKLVRAIERWFGESAERAGCTRHALETTR